jgi:hypothetical protein
MPTSTRRQAASRSQRYSEVSVDAPSSLDDEEAGQQESPRRERRVLHSAYQPEGDGPEDLLTYPSEHLTVDEENDVNYAGPTDHTVFEGSGKYYIQPKTSTSD